MKMPCVYAENRVSGTFNNIGTQAYKPQNTPHNGGNKAQHNRKQAAVKVPHRRQAKPHHSLITTIGTYQSHRHGCRTAEESDWRLPLWCHQL